MKDGAALAGTGQINLQLLNVSLGGRIRSAAGGVAVDG